MFLCSIMVMLRLIPKSVCTCWLRNTVFQSMFSRKPLRERRAIEREKACENRTLINGILVFVGEKNKQQPATFTIVNIGLNQ